MSYLSQLTEVEVVLSGALGGHEKKQQPCKFIAEQNTTKNTILQTKRETYITIANNKRWQKKNKKTS